MIYRFHLSHSFGRLKDAALHSFGSAVLTQMTGNEYFPDPIPSLDEFGSDLQAYEKALEATIKGGGRNATAKKKAALLDLQTLASYVQSHGQNDPLILTSSGFHLWKTRAPVGVLPAPGSLRYRYVKTGELYLLCARVRRAANYTTQVALSSTGPWEGRGVSPSTRITITNLVPGTRYWIRICANGTAGPSPWSSALSVIAV